MTFWKKLWSGCADLSLDCRQASRAQSDALEGPLPASKRTGLWIHLRLCALCRRYGRQLQFLHRAAHDHAESLTDPAPGGLDPAARERMKKQLRERPPE